MKDTKESSPYLKAFLKELAGNAEPSQGDEWLEHDVRILCQHARAWLVSTGKADECVDVAEEKIISALQSRQPKKLTVTIREIERAINFSLIENVRFKIHELFKSKGFKVMK